MDIQKVKATYRRANRDAYPELSAYSPEEIYRDSMGPGGLYLATVITRPMDLHEGDIVLDLGCGRGETSIFMARHFGVRVVALDLWTSATYLNGKFSARGYRQQITPLQMDITKELPFAEGYFDAIFCMNSLSFYGGSVEFLHHLLVHLKSGGVFSVGSEGFNGEFTPEQCANPPAVFAWEHPSHGSVWDGDFSKQHSPLWWKRLFLDSGMLEVFECRELEDGVVLMEDQVLYNIEHDIDLEDAARYVDQLEWGRTNRPYETILMLAARRV